MTVVCLSASTTRHLLADYITDTPSKIHFAISELPNLKQLTDSEISRMKPDEFFSIPWGSTSNDVSSVRDNLERNGFAFIRLDLFGISSYKELQPAGKSPEFYRFPLDVKQKVIAVMNQLNLLRKGMIVSVKSVAENGHSGALQQFHADFTGGELKLWLTTQTNKHLIAIERHIGSALFILDLLGDAQRRMEAKYILENHAKISRPGQAVIFWSIDDETMNPCLHAGFIDQTMHGIQLFKPTKWKGEIQATSVIAEIYFE